MMKKKLFLFLVVVAFILSIAVRFWHLEETKPKELTYRVVNFHDLPGWQDAQLEKSLAAFKVSCQAFLKQNPEKSVGSSLFSVQVKNWRPACEALKAQEGSTQVAKSFFEQWFVPVEFYQGKPVQGLFTGYYSPLLHGSLKKGNNYQVPLYATPKDLVSANLALFNVGERYRKIFGRVIQKKLVPYYTRAQINNGAIKGKSKVIAWIDNPIDRQFLEIQGSGVVKLEDGSKIFVGYSAQNGRSYTSLAKVLIDKGVMTRDNASMQGIKKYLESHPKEKHKILNQNESFVFFEVLGHNAALGSQGVALTPGYSLAVDRQWVPLGTPVWLNTTHPGKNRDDEHALQRLMIAQDTGGAIKGPVRGDVYWGDGDEATYIAGHMKNPGRYWLLLPKAYFDS